MFDGNGGWIGDGARLSGVAPVTNPPPPGNWGPPQPPYGQGQPPYGSGPWPPQQGWGPPPQPPKNNSLKWLLIGVAVLLVIAISVGATLLFTRDGGGGTTQTANGNPPAAGEIASANDTGPVSIITEDPTCEPSRPVTDTLAQQQRQGWESRDYTLPASAWTPEQRVMHQEVAEAMRRAADQSVQLAKQTPHRVMRELYEQSIAFWRAYADSVPDYSPDDNYFAMAAGNASGAIVAICSAIDLRSAQARGPLVQAGPAPQDVSPPQVSNSPALLINSSSSSVCQPWMAASNKFDSNAGPWHGIDPAIPASNWTANQRSEMTSMAEVMSNFADELEHLGQESENAIVADFAELSSQYWRAFSLAVPSYTTADSYLSGTAAYTVYLVVNACAAAGE